MGGECGHGAFDKAPLLLFNLQEIVEGALNSRFREAGIEGRRIVFDTVRVRGGSTTKVKDMFWTRTLLVLVVTGWTLTASAARDYSEAEPFYGEFEGEAVMTTDGEITQRDLRVKISPHSEGFTVGWIAVSRKPSGKVKRKEQTIDFYPTRRDHIYRSGERRDFFGNPVPRDPLKGDPYVWARIDGSTLTIYAMHVLEDGGYEMQVFERTRIPEGLELKYHRVRDGEVLRTITGILREVE